MSFLLSARDPKCQYRGAQTGSRRMLRDDPPRYRSGILTRFSPDATFAGEAGRELLRGNFSLEADKLSPEEDKLFLEAENLVLEGDNLVLGSG